MCSRDIYSILFFIYGLAFFSLGISALQQRFLKDTNIPLLKSIKILGAFGVVHGLSEWILMFIMIDKNNKFATNLMFFENFLSAISFTLLWVFGTRFYKEKINRINYLRISPYIVIGVWSILHIILFVTRYDSYTTYIHVFKVASKFLIGVPAGLTVCIGLYRNGRIIKKLNDNRVDIKFKLLATSFGVYSILAGVIVSNIDLYPARIINTTTFFCKLGFPLELSRTLVAVIIAILFINVIDIFMWEVEYRIEKLMHQKLLWQERRKVGYELHDRVIQDLFASGLALESIIEDSDNAQKDILICVKETLNSAITEIRGFIHNSSLEKLNINDFKIKLTDLINKMEKLGEFKIKLSYNVSEVTVGTLSSEALEQIYYIIQECISNSIKHSKGSKICIKLKSTLEELIIVVKDDGVGLDYDNIGKEGQYGLLSMKERADSINGTLKIDSSKNGVVVNIIIPWESELDDK